MEEHLLFHVRYMADSVAREDEANFVFWLATQAGKMAVVLHEKILLNIWPASVCSLMLTIHVSQ